MKLVVNYTEGDGCTYCCEVNAPFEYESAEKLLVDIEELANGAIRHEIELRAAWAEFQERWPTPPSDRNSKERAKWWSEYEVMHEKWHSDKAMNPTLQAGDSTVYISHFIEDGKFNPPNIYTVDEWFSVNGIK